MIILSLLYDYDEGGGYIVFVEIFYGFHPDFCQIGSPELVEILTIERVKLEIDLKIGLIGREPLRKCLIFGYLDTVRIDHEISKWSSFGSVEYLPKFWMNSRFSP
jgi:hypothetical protein